MIQKANGRIQNGRINNDTKILPTKYLCLLVKNTCSKRFNKNSKNKELIVLKIGSKEHFLSSKPLLLQNKIQRRGDCFDRKQL